MPFREKSAWISMVCLLGTFGVFFVLLIQGVLGPRHLAHFHWFLHAVFAFILLQVVLHLIARGLAPLDAKAPLDERERTILLKGARNAYLALVLSLLTIPLSLHLPGPVHWPALPWLAVGGLFISEVVRAISQIVYFRLGR